MKRAFLLFVAVLVLVVSGCYGGHKAEIQDEDRTDGGGGDQRENQTDTRSDSQMGESHDGQSEAESENGRFEHIDVDELLSKPPEEAAEVAADAVCAYFDECMQQGISCEITQREFSGPGSPSEGAIDVNCIVVDLDRGLDDCVEEMTVLIHDGFECANISSEQASQLEACLSALRLTECMEITDELLREYEAAVARGEGSAVGNLPAECAGLDEVFDCADQRPSDPPQVLEPQTGSLSCLPNQVAACTCADGLKGIQTCMSDGTFSLCVCGQGVTPTPGGASSGAAGAGGAAPMPCIAGETRSCYCPDGSQGTQVCIDGRSFTFCECG